MGYAALGKNLSGREELWASVWTCGEGVRNMAEARPSQDWAVEGSNEEDPTHPERAHLPDDPSQTEQSHKKKTEDVGKFRRCQGRRKGILGAEGGFKPHPVERQ